MKEYNESLWKLKDSDQLLLKLKEDGYSIYCSDDNDTVIIAIGLKPIASVELFTVNREEVAVLVDEHLFCFGEYTSLVNYIKTMQNGNSLSLCGLTKHSTTDLSTEEVEAFKCISTKDKNDALAERLYIYRDDNLLKRLVNYGLFSALPVADPIQDYNLNAMRDIYGKKYLNYVDGLYAVYLYGRYGIEKFSTEDPTTACNMFRTCKRCRLNPVQESYIESSKALLYADEAWHDGIRYRMQGTFFQDVGTYKQLI